MASAGSSKVSVTWEDQQNINKFSNLYSRLGDIEQQLKEQKKLLDNLDDASAELMLADDDEPVRMRVGECFWGIDKTAAEEKLEALTEEAQQHYRQLEQQMADGQQQLGELRTQLYARLGDSINLDTPYTDSK
ncbi:hypothetical protein OEZ86_007486 [Tetradesmus obliquus]|nr:hypothetical protein OEZ86_007486 [Tetradesmus obliquus]